MKRYEKMPMGEFQSTLPMRGATNCLESPIARYTFQSTLPMRGATVTFTEVNIANFEFQSTLPMRGATDQPKT